MISRTNRGSKKLDAVFCFVALGFAVATWMGYSADRVHAQAGPDMSHSGIECIPTTEFSILNAIILPGDEVRTARVYFRSDKYPDFYYVDMTSSGDNFQAILPMPSDDTSRVFYYLEATDIDYASNRTVEFDAEVVGNASECKRRDPAVAYFNGTNPGIVIGAMQAGAPAIPPGFLAQGIVSAAGGGIGTGAAIGIAAGAAGAVGVGVLATQNEEETTTTAVAVVTVPPGPPPTTPTTTTTATTGEAVEACFNTLPDPPVITAGDRIKLDGRCSKPEGFLTFLWDLGDGRRKQGSFLEPRFSMSGTYTIELEVSRSSSLTGLAQRDPNVDYVRREIVVKPAEVLETADLTVTKTGTPSPFPRYDNEEPLIYTVTVFNVGSLGATGVTLVDNLPQDMDLNVQTLPPGCTSIFETLTCDLNAIPAGASVVLEYELYPAWEGAPDFLVNNVVVQAENDANTGNNSASVTIPLTPELGQRELESQKVPVELTSYLGVRPFDGRLGGQVMLNGAQVVPTNNASPARHRFQGKLGKNTVEAVITSSMEGEGFWRFDFRGVQGYVSGSLNAEMGQVIAIDGQAVVFRLSGVPNERIRFSFKLVP